MKGKKSKQGVPKSDEVHEINDDFDAEFEKELNVIPVRVTKKKISRKDSNGFKRGAKKPLTNFPSGAVRAKKYFHKDIIGEGQYGKVYRSIDLQTNKEVSLFSG